MLGFLKKLAGQKPESGCCAIEIKEVDAKEDQCCGTANEDKNEACCR